MFMAVSNMDRSTLRVLVVEHRPLLCEGMKAILRRSTEPLFESVVLDLDHLETVDAREAQPPHLVWCRMRDITTFQRNAARLHRLFPEAHLVVIDDVFDAMRLQIALKMGAKGFLLSNQPAEEFISLLKAAARGEWAFAPSLLPWIKNSALGVGLSSEFQDPESAPKTSQDHELTSYRSHRRGSRVCTWQDSENN